MRSDVAISVKNLTKTYRIFGHPGDRIKQALTLGKVKFHSEFTALKDVSFDIMRGETIGIIGRNGSGKSTLLQLICGILKPTSGSVQVHGRVSALLELGAGFNLEFTGRENVYFQGALMGFTEADMDARIDDIAAFADIGEFIDQPVRTYSSGMFVRLAFSVAIHVDPEILVLDEALAVGDAQFQVKCFQRIRSIQNNGVSILFVTHVVEQVAHVCDRVLLLNKGMLCAEGSTEKVLEQYIKFFNVTTPNTCADTSSNISNNHKVSSCSNIEHMQEVRWGDRQAEIKVIKLMQNNHQATLTLMPGLKAKVVCHVKFYKDIARPIYGLSVKTPEGAVLFNTNTRELLGTVGAPMQKAGDEITIGFVFTPFLDLGEYFISVGVASENQQGLLPHDRRYNALKFLIAHPLTPTGNIEMNPSFQIIAQDAVSKSNPES